MGIRDRAGRNFVNAVQDLRNVFQPNDLSTGQRLGKAAIGVGGILTGGLIPETGRSEAIVPKNVFSEQQPAPVQGAAPGTRQLGAQSLGQEDDYEAQLAAMMSGGGAGGAGTAYQPSFVPSPLTGELLDENDPGQREVLFQHQQQVFDQNVETSLQDLQRQYGISRRDAEEIYSRQLEDFAAQEQKIGLEQERAGQEYAGQRDDLAGQLSQNQVGIAQTYAQAAPSALQSSQISTGVENRSNYFDAVGDVALAENRFNQDASGALSTIGQERSRLGTDYGQFVDDSQYDLQNRVAGIRNQAAQQRAQGVAAFTNADRDQGVGGFRFSAANVAPVQAAAVDTSSFGAYQPFSGLQAGAQAAVPTVRNYFSPEQAGGTGLDSYLGRVKPSKKEKNAFQGYVTGTA